MTSWNEDDLWPSKALTEVPPPPVAPSPRDERCRDERPRPKGKRGPGRPRSVPGGFMVKPVLARLPLATQARLESRCRETGCTPSTFIRAAIERELDRLERAHA